MYRLCKLFISDVTAGDNLLRNAYVPIIRENGTADHGVLFAANGTCKTTLLSFILNVFCPEQRRFVQHLQSTGDKTLEQYLIPGHPAVVLVDLTSLEQPTLFDAAPEAHLVLGQLLYRSKGIADKLERIFFIAHSPEFFDQLRHAWDDLLNQEQPWRAVRDFIAQNVQQTTLQSEWTSVLERLGLDPWLLDRQIDFARSEGGIKDAFKFRSEPEFLNFFLGCVTDLEAADTLRKNIGQSLRKMENRPRKLAQLQTARELKEYIRNYSVIARSWLDAQKEVDGSKIVLGEAAYLIAQAKTMADQQVELRSKALKLAKADRAKAYLQREINTSNLTAVEQCQLSRAIAQAEKDSAQVEQDIELFKAEENSLKAADLMADIRRNRVQTGIKLDVLHQAGEELSPLIERITILGLQYHTRLDEDRRCQLELIDKRQLRIEELMASIRAGESQRTEHLATRSALEEQQLTIAARIQAAEERRRALPMQPGELPADALSRLDETLYSLTTRINAVKERRSLLEEEMQASDEHWRSLQQDQSEARVQRDQARQHFEDEIRQRQRLLDSAHIQRVAGKSIFDPTSAELVSRFDDALARSWDRLEKKKQQRLDLSRELERLEGTETLTVDAQTRKLLSHYHEQGIALDELRAYPEYLAGRYADPEDIARFIESDPGRFTGLMASSENVIKTVMTLPVPDWLHRPVILSPQAAPDDLQPISSTVICPKDPGVYSRRHLELTRAQLLKQLNNLDQAIHDQTREIREMENDSRALHGYREQFPDTFTVSGLSQKLQSLDHRVGELGQAIVTRETLAATLKKNKAEQEAALYSLTAENVRLDEHRQQINDWISKYTSLQTWQQKAEQIKTKLKTLASRMEEATQTLHQMREEVAALRADNQVSESLLKGLDERAADVTRSQDTTLSEDHRRDALTMDRETLKRLYEEAREHQRHRANTLGVSTTQRELDELENTISHQEAHLESMLRTASVDENLLENWIGHSATEREERRAVLSEILQQKNGTLGELRSGINYQKRDLEKLNEMLAKRSSKGMQPDITEADLSQQNLDDLLHRFQVTGEHSSQNLERLELRCSELEADLKAHEVWQREAELALAATQTFTPVWDQLSPREDWPGTIGTAELEDNITVIRTLNTQTHERMKGFEEQRQALDTARSKLGTGFERLRSELTTDRFTSHLPAVIDELMHYDSESLGIQAKELIQRCEEIAQNIENDLAISQRIMDNLVDMLLSRAKEYHQKLQTAAQQILPEDVFIYGGQSILRAGTRLDFTRHGENFKRSVENWLHELIQQNRLPEVNQRTGNCLGSELLYQLLRASTGKKDFGIRILKCDDTGRNYEPVGKDLGSGGEALTTAVLLYTLLIFMRKKRSNHPDGRLPAFLVLDNPLGVCNRSDFLDAQLKVAKAMGIQCVYLTGINDGESLGLFELRVAIRKGGKKVEIGNKTYDVLEIVELNVEKTDSSVLA